MISRSPFWSRNSHSGLKMRLRAAVLTAGFLMMAFIAVAQTLDLERDRVAMTDLAGPWRFHTGDDPAWSSPAFDDSGWSLLLAGKPWTEQGYASYSGVAWYRLRILVPAHSGDLAFYLPGVGRPGLRQRPSWPVGWMPPHRRWLLRRRLLFGFPAIHGSRRPLVAPVRIWRWPRKPRAWEAANSIPAAHRDHAIAGQRQQGETRLFRAIVATFVESYADFLTSLAGFGFFLLRRDAAACGGASTVRSSACWARNLFSHQLPAHHPFQVQPLLVIALFCCVHNTRSSSM